MRLPNQTLRIETREYSVHAAAKLRSGWHRLRIDLITPGRDGIRKRLAIEADEAAIATLEWNDRLRDDFLVRLEQPAKSLRLTLYHAQGEATLHRFSMSRVSPLRTTLRALRAKLRLLRQFNCVGPVLRRGTRLLLRGDLSAVKFKLLKGLPDSRVMKLEAKRAEEAGGAWWRRRAMAVEEIEKYRDEAGAIIDPVPVAVFLPADATRIDHARQAAFSVLRQVYPHWQLRILWPGQRVPEKLAGAVRHESRVKIVTGDDLATAMRTALAEVPCEQAVVQSPDAELAEHALLKLTNAPFTRLADHAVTLPVATLARHLPDDSSSMALSVLRWTLPLATKESSDPLAFALDGGRDPSLASLPPRPVTQSIHLAGNFSGISGWDALAYQVLKGLAASGVEVKRHHHTPLRSHTLPPGLTFEKSHRTANDPLLIVAPPYQMKSFAPDAFSAAFTMWECDRLPASEVRFLNEARVVIVPSRWGEETFRNSGVSTSIERVPLGYDPLIFHPRVTATTQCIFGTAGALGAGGLRKNIGMVIAAFRAAFPRETDVRLRIKLTPNCVGLELPDDSRIDITRAVLPPAEVAAWNRSLTAYVNASFAEGFGLHLLEAMACGVPLVSTAVSGPADYFDESVGYVLPHRDVEVRNDVYAGRWYEPDFDAMVDAMRRIHREGTGDRGQSAACRARKFTWRDTGRQLLRVLTKYDLLRSAS